MRTIKVLSVTFEDPISPYETPAFRGAVIEKVGVHLDNFHNHDNDPNSPHRYFYRYPLIQYKQLQRRPTIVFVEKGIDEAQHFFTQPDWNLHFAGRDYKTSIKKMIVNSYSLGISAEPRWYTVRKWMALNQHNYETYQQLDGASEEIQFLENKLVAHILSMSKGLGHRFGERVELKISKVLGSRFLPYEGVKVKTFDVCFKTNVLLPSLVGIGKGVARGYGILNTYQPKKSPARVAYH